MSKYNVVLASKSPRRRSLLKELGIDFITTSVNVEETYPVGLTPVEIAHYLARLKAEAYTFTSKETLIITADTIVSLRGRILGKPAGYDEAYHMLSLLSGRLHEVITGVCVKSTMKTEIFSALTHVHFKQLLDEEIHYYIQKYKPYDKAGSYGIQEWIGYIGIDKIEGSFYNVMGLPVQRLYEELKRF